MIKFILEYIFVFLTGAIMGWCLEVIYRRFFGLAKKWINPGFLSGPFLPLYGTALCVLYIISEIRMPMITRIVLFTAITTGFEYVTGLFFLKIYKTRLWDYSHMKLNVQGLIHPLYSFFWTTLSLVFYYFLYPFFYQNVVFLYQHLEFSLIIGIILGLIFVDIIQSFDILNKLKSLADQLEGRAAIIQYDLLKMEIRDRFKGRPLRPKFMRPLKGDFSLREQLKLHFERLR